MALFVAKNWIPRCEPKKMANVRCELTPHFILLCIQPLSNPPNPLQPQWLPWILRMSRPGRPLTKKSIQLQVILSHLIHNNSNEMVIRLKWRSWRREIRAQTRCWRMSSTWTMTFSLPEGWGFACYCLNCWGKYHIFYLTLSNQGLWRFKTRLWPEFHPDTSSRWSVASDYVNDSQSYQRCQSY